MVTGKGSKVLRHSGRPREPGRAPRNARGGAPARTVVGLARLPTLWTHVHCGTLSANRSAWPPARGELRPFHIERFRFHLHAAFLTQNDRADGDDKHPRGRGHGHCAGLSLGQAFSVCRTLSSWPWAGGRAHFGVEEREGDRVSPLSTAGTGGPGGPQGGSN